MDVYVCLNPMGIFCLREEAPPHESEWNGSKTEVIVCVLEISKGDRNKQEITHSRADAVENWRRMN